MKYITFTTSGSLKLCENFLLSTRNVGIEDSVTVYCLDTKSFDVISDYNCEVKLFDVSVSDDFHEYGRHEFRRITEAKIQIILNALAENESLIYTDCDVVFVDDPTEHINEIEENTRESHPVDIFFASDDPFMKICTGFMYIKNNSAVHSLFNKYFELNSMYSEQKNEHMFDQEIIYEILRTHLLEDTITWGAYPTSFIKNGHLYWSESERTGNESVIHCNFTIGEQNKINKFKEANLWYIKEEVTK